MSFHNFLHNQNTTTEASTISTDELQKELNKRENANIFPLEVFNPKIKPFINDLHLKYDVPRSYIGLAMLVAYSTSIGTAYVVSRNGSDKMCLSVWGCMNGISSSGKSLALSMILEPLEEIQKYYDREWEEKSGNLPDEARQKSVMKSIIYRDAYIPTLIRYLLPVNPKGVLKYCDEILEWINGLNQLSKKESTDEQFWLSAWNGLKYSAIRSGNVKIVIPRVFTNIIGGIQPKLLYKLFKNERGDSGFIFRVLFANTEVHKIAQPEPGYEIPIEYREIHRKVLESMVDRLPVSDMYQEPNICICTPESIKVINVWEKEKALQINHSGDVNEMNIKAGVLGKIKEYIYRFAGLLAISDAAYKCIDSDFTIFPDRLEITSDIMKRAIKLGDYFYQSALDVYTTVDNTMTAPPEVLLAANCFRMNYSYSKIAKTLWGDERQKVKARRFIQKNILEYPKIFGAVNK